MILIQKKLQAKYNILDTFVANEIFINEILYYVSNPSIGSIDQNFIHNEYTTCLVFPHYGIRVACTKVFIELKIEIVFATFQKEKLL